MLWKKKVFFICLQNICLKFLKKIQMFLSNIIRGFLLFSISDWISVELLIHAPLRLLWPRWVFSVFLKSFLVGWVTHFFFFITNQWIWNFYGLYLRKSPKNGYWVSPHLGQLHVFKFLQLSQETQVWPRARPGRPHGGQGLHPAALGHRHDVGHHQSHTAGHACHAAPNRPVSYSKLLVFQFSAQMHKEVKPLFC